MAWSVVAGVLKFPQICLCYEALESGTLQYINFVGAKKITPQKLISMAFFLCEHDPYTFTYCSYSFVAENYLFILSLFTRADCIDIVIFDLCNVVGGKNLTPVTLLSFASSLLPPSTIAMALPPDIVYGSGNSAPPP